MDKWSPGQSPRHLARMACCSCPTWRASAHRTWTLMLVASFWDSERVTVERNVRAVLEGVTLACYDAYQVLAELGARPDRIIMAGGGARSQLWQQIVADVFNLPVQRLEQGDQSAWGAVLLAGGGIGLFDPQSTAQAWASYGPPIEPDGQRHALYQNLMPLFRDAYQRHREHFRRLRDL